MFALPLFDGGNRQGALQVAELSTFGAVAFLAATGELPQLMTQARGIALALLAILAAATMSTIFTSQLDVSVPTLVRWLWLGALVVVVTKMSERRDTRELAIGLLLVSLIVQLFWSNFVYWGGRDSSRFQVGTFYAPNQFAGYLVLLSPLAWAGALAVRDRARAAFWMVLSSVTLYTLIRTRSRGAVVVAIAGGLVVVAMSGQRPRRVIGRSVGIAVVLFALLLVPISRPSSEDPAETASSVGQSGVRTKEPADEGLRVRLDYVRAGLRIGSRHPLVGAGLGTYGAEALHVGEPKWSWSKWAHNDYVEAFAEGGIPLAAALLSLPIVSILAGRRRRAPVREDAPWAVGLFAGLVAGSLHLLVDHDLSFGGYAAAFVTVATLTAVGEAQVARMAPKPVARMGFFIVATCAAAFVGAAVVASAVTEPAELRRPHLAAYLQPEAARPRVAAARALALTGAHDDLRSAAAWFRAAIRRDTLTPALRWQLASVYEGLGEVTRARAEYRAALEVRPGLPAATALAEFELRQRRPARAAAVISAELHRSGAYAPGNNVAQALIRRGQAFLALGSVDAAGRDARAATAKAPDARAAWLLRAQIACDRQATAEATAALQKATSLGSTPPIDVRLAAAVARGCR